MKAIMFFVIVGIALLVSGNATYDVLTGSVGVQTYIALAAAVVIDAAAIWLGHHTTVLAQLGDETKAAQLATWFVVFISLCVNFFHGYTQGGYAGGLVGIIFPLLAAILFEFFIRHTIREELKARGLILPGKPNWIRDKKYGDKAEDEQLERDYVAYTRDVARQQMRQLRDSVTTSETEIDLSLTDETTSVTAGQPIETSVTTERDSETELVLIRDTDETTSLATQVDQAFAEQMLRDMNETMTIKEIIEVLMKQGMKDYAELQNKVSEIKGQPVSRDTIRTTANRVKNETA